MSVVEVRRPHKACYGSSFWIIIAGDFSLMNARSLQDAGSVHHRRMGLPGHHRETRAADFHPAPGNRDTGGLCVEEIELVASRELRNSGNRLRLGRDIARSRARL